MWKTTCALLVGVLVLWSGETGSDPNAIYVLSASPDWKMGQKELTKGEKLPSNTSLQLTAGTADAAEAAYLVLRCPNRVWQSYKCKSACTVPVCSAESKGQFQVKQINKGGPLLASSSRLFDMMRRDPSSLRDLSVKGDGDPNEAVVLLQGDTVHLAPALNRVVADQYCFRLYPLEANVSSPPISFRLKWSRDDEPEGLVQVPDAVPGAYELAKGAIDSNGTCRFDSKSVPAWIAIASEAHFKEMTQRWQESRSWFDELSDSGASAEVQTTAQRAVIADLTGDLPH